MQNWEDEADLAETVGCYLRRRTAQGEAALVVARPAHFELFKRQLPQARAAGRSGQLRYFDAEDTMAKFMRDGMPDWKLFHAAVGGLIAELRLQYPAVRVYGEMVDVLWQRGEREAAIRLEEFWNDLAQLQTFSLFCAYQLDDRDSLTYGGSFQCVCQPAHAPHSGRLHPRGRLLRLFFFAGFFGEVAPAPADLAAGGRSSRSYSATLSLPSLVAVVAVEALDQVGVARRLRLGQLAVLVVVELVEALVGQRRLRRAGALRQVKASCLQGLAGSVPLHLVTHSRAL